MTDYSKYLMMYLSRKEYKYRNMTFNFTGVEMNEEYGDYTFHVSVNTEKDESYLTNHVLIEIENKIIKAINSVGVNPETIAYSIDATLNGDIRLDYNNVYISDEKQNEILNSFNYYMNSLKRFGVLFKLIKVVVENKSQDEVNFTFVPLMSLPEGKTLKEIPIEAVQNAIYETIETLLDNDFTDDEGQGVTFNVKITPRI